MNKEKNKFKLRETLKPILNAKISFNENIKSNQSSKKVLDPTISQVGCIEMNRWC